MHAAELAKREKCENQAEGLQSPLSQQLLRLRQKRFLVVALCRITLLTRSALVGILAVPLHFVKLLLNGFFRHPTPQPLQRLLGAAITTLRQQPVGCLRHEADGDCGGDGDDTANGRRDAPRGLGAQEEDGGEAERGSDTSRCCKDATNGGLAVRNLRKE